VLTAAWLVVAPPTRCENRLSPEHAVDTGQVMSQGAPSTTRSVCYRPLRYRVEDRPQRRKRGVQPLRQQATTSAPQLLWFWVEAVAKAARSVRGHTAVISLFFGDQAITPYARWRSSRAAAVRLAERVAMHLPFDREFQVRMSR
jgi:hypothetical protein